MSDPDSELSLTERIDHACDRLKESRDSTDPLSIEDILSEFPDSESNEVLRELLAVEIDLRLKKGETFRKEEYFERLPKHKSVVLDLFDSHMDDSDRIADTTRRACKDTTHPSVVRRDNTTIGEQVPEKIGKYRVVEALDRGGQAAIYRAIHPEFRRDVVIKFCHTERSSGNASHEALASEGRVLASLEHPNLARVFDFDFHENRAYLVMEFIPGLNLSQYQKQNAPGTETWVPMIQQIANALSYVHSKGVVHLDIKPQNILIDESGIPRLIDFGLSRKDAGWDEFGSNVSMLSGTLAYMAPEQANCDSNAIGPKSDIFGLGGVMYFLATGKAPRNHGDFEALFNRARKGDWDRELLSEKCEPPMLGLIEESLDPDPANRTPSAGELSQKLAALQPSPRFAHRYKWLAIALLSLFLIPLVNIALQKSTHEMDVPEALDLSSEMQIRVWRNGDTFDLADVAPIGLDDRVEIRANIPSDTAVSLFLFDSEGKLQLVSSENARESPFEFRFPSNPSQFETIVGPPGTEFVFLCGRHGDPVTVNEIQDHEVFSKIWPALPPGAVIGIRHDQVQYIQRDRGFGGGVDTIDPQQHVFNQLETLRSKLGPATDLIEGVAFSHAP